VAAIKEELGLEVELVEGSGGDFDVEVDEGSGGDFDVEVDGDVVFSKAGAGRFPEVGEVIELLKGYI
jgi:predicted Rdx family selenoprotein